MATAADLTPEQFAEYRAASRRRHEAERRALAAREERAWEVARQAAAALRERFGVERVVVFGSLTRPGHFTPWSDIDIAAWGLRPEDTFRAIGVAMDVSREFAVNLVEVVTCSASLIRSIEDEGVPV